MRCIVQGRGRLQPRLIHRSHSKRFLSSVSQLDSWDVDVFKQDAFDVAKPAKLLRTDDHILPACTRWFVHGVHGMPELRTPFWHQFKDVIVPLEITLGSQESNNHPSGSPKFQRADAPLDILLTYLRHPLSYQAEGSDVSIYLAQCSLQSLPHLLQDDVPTPDIVLQAGNGDVYESSLWLGRSPTYTPLHRDPNPNFFLQLAGKKAVRLLPPLVGDTLFNLIQSEIHKGQHTPSSSTAIRGEEMMTGLEAALLHSAVWESRTKNSTMVQEYGQEVEVEACEALFIPKGWWHSVKGVGEGVNASANWWFR